MIQEIRLGLTGSETAIPTLGRSLTSFGFETVSLSGRAADGTLHEDFVNFKRNWSVSYQPISQTNAALIFGFYNIQFTNNSFLSMIITDESGAESSFVARMSEPLHGALIQRNVYHYESLTFTLQEV